jgi:hypothetical protein
VLKFHLKCKKSSKIWQQINEWINKDTCFLILDVFSSK